MARLSLRVGCPARPTSEEAGKIPGGAAPLEAAHHDFAMSPQTMSEGGDR